MTKENLDKQRIDHILKELELVESRNQALAVIISGKVFVDNEKILKPGKICKFVESVDQITFSGEQALIQGQEVLYVTDRAVFSLKKDGIELIEIAPGIEIVKDILSLMKFKPLISIFTTKLEGIIFVGGGSTPPPSALPSPEHEKSNTIINNLYI